MKRLIVGTAMAVALLAGQASADTTLQLTEVITSPQRTELLKGMIAKFEAANPGVKVEVTSLPWGQAFEKLATMVQGGQIPDVVEMPDRWLALYANNDQLESLKPWMDQLARDQGADRPDARVRLGGQGHALHDPLRLLHPGDVLEQEAVQAGRHGRPARDHGRLHGGVEEDLRPGRRQDRLLPARRPRRHQRLHDDDGQHGRHQRVVRRGRQLDARQARGDLRAAVPGRHVPERLRVQGQRQLGLQRDRGRLLLRQLCHARPGPRRADRDRREDAQGGLRGGAHAAGAARQVVPDHRLCRLGHVHAPASTRTRPGS